MLVPIGFVSDHMEVIYDLDTEAAATARELGLPFARAATAGTDPAFVAALVDLIVERARGAAAMRLGRPSPTACRWSPEGARALRLPAVLLPESARAGPTGPVPVRPCRIVIRQMRPDSAPEFWARATAL